MKPTANQKIILRALEPDDIELLYQWENDKSIWPVSNTLAPFSRHILQKYIESSHQDIFQVRQLRLMIDLYENKEKKTVGTIDLFDFEPVHLRAGVGILVFAEEHRNKRVASMALQQVMEYAADTLHLNQLFCNIAVDNEYSIKLFENAGFELVGIKKKWNRTEAGFADEALYQSILTKGHK